MNRREKETVLTDLRGIFESSGLVVVAHYNGMSVFDMQQFRTRMRHAGGGVKVAKNTLVRLALHDMACQGLQTMMNGMTVLSYSEDPVTAAKVIDEYSNENSKLSILGGAMGNTILDEAGIRQLAKMPSRDELIAAVVGCVLAPAANLSSTIGAPAAHLAGILSTIEDKHNDAAAA